MESGLADTVTPGEEADVRDPRVVREAVYRLVTGRRPGEEFDAKALDTVNAAARKAP
ncbi:ABATE domain-containing protein [Streptomyces sp. NPDC086519]|uniref:ABATE domain-containing protein n=1 Tax=Streptomyces sp. NPDC086519 TaxID=3154863 RepID=UPI003437F5DA